MTAATDLAQYFATAKSADLPESPMNEMRRLLLDYLGVALSGSQSESGEIVGRVMSSLGGEPQSTVIGSGQKIPAVHAAFANAVSEHSIELDDVDNLALFHYGPPVVSTALAVAEWQQSTGLELLGAVLYGAEMMNRLSLATNPALRNRAFHTTPALGVFGATVAAGRLLGLTVEQLTDAFGLAGAQASGLMEMYGPSMQKRVNPGPAARNGITAAMLAQAHYTGADTIFEGERGFGFAFAGGIDVDVLLAGLGTSVPVEVEYKAYSAARPIHNAIDAALRFRDAGVTADQVDKVVVHRHPDWAEYHRNPAPRTIHEAQVSLPYSTAIALVEGSALPAQYAENQLRRPELKELIARISIETDASLPRGVSCRVELTNTDGDVVVEQVDDPKGSAGDPMNDEDLRAKFTALAAPVIGPEQAGVLSDAVERIRDAESIDGLLALTEAREPSNDGA